MELLTLLSVLKEQQAEAEVLLSNSISIDRELAPQYLSSVQDPLIKIISGVRRSGKSFFSIQSLPKNSWVYINFDDERLIEISSKDLNNVYNALIQIKSNPKYFIFDEIQNIKNWDLFINRLKRKGLNIILTGSNGKLLSKEISTHLTGRHTQLEIFPFSFREFLAYKKIVFHNLVKTEESALVQKSFSDYLNEGGFPELRVIQNKSQYLRDLFDRIISRDILQRYKLRSSLSLKQLAIFLIHITAHEISYKKASSTLHLGSMNTAKKYIQYLSDCYLFFELECYSFKIRERLTKPRKIYSIDTGLYNSLQTSHSDNFGAQLENVVFLELRRHFKEIYYYKAPGYEVDFLITKDRKTVQIIQVCHTLSDPATLNREVNGLLKAAQELRCKNLLLLTFSEEKVMTVNGSDIVILPIWKWLITDKITDKINNLQQSSSIYN